ncbi:hypothetical protein [Jannaschia ovalis]|uniref:Uncharacterized protein n=1 Tax=Jannaschia ovalis TaxID=3038773 RepID=A0ABY8L9V0_9RHOB|nr:hypothetical protein [Jannaschia sp. GRR-S6-38]WGH78081.1 hypothetical protein P8627_13730 [Jannaschia sp. GRR-S6-38]
MDEDRDVIRITAVLRQAADALLAATDGDADEAVGLARFNAERDDHETAREFRFAQDLLHLCMRRALAAHGDRPLIEVIDTGPPPPERRILYELEIPTE